MYPWGLTHSRSSLKSVGVVFLQTYKNKAKHSLEPPSVRLGGLERAGGGRGPGQLQVRKDPSGWGKDRRERLKDRKPGRRLW